MRTRILAIFGESGQFCPNNDQIDQNLEQYRFEVIYPSHITQYVFLLYNKIQTRLAVILSMLARARATKKRKAKPLKIKPKSGSFGSYFEKCRLR